ncbi:MAG: hemerythrin domain-containing protein [Chloroflexia bacterium]|nr:hemerythrin domain-containing protein [Chloroflexia bacterium]
MSHLSKLGLLLHEEHFRILVLISGIEHRVSGNQARMPLDPDRPEDRLQLNELSDSLDELVRHNAFEEEVLFPLACNGGEGDLAALLNEEHGIIGPLTRRLRQLVAEITHGGAGADRWGRFCFTARDFVACMMDHLQNEELALVQRLPVFIDPVTDRGLAQRFGAERGRHRFGPAFQLST